MFADEIKVNLGSNAVAVVMIGFQNRFTALNEKNTSKAVELANT